MNVMAQCSSRVRVSCGQLSRRLPRRSKGSWVGLGLYQLSHKAGAA